MRILIVTPAPPDARFGNNVTAERWSILLKQLGHEVVIARSYDAQESDVLIALHALKSAGAVRGFKDLHPQRPVILCLTGTDVYSDIVGPEASESVQTADRLIVLQPLAALELPEEQRGKVRTVYQSAVAPPPPPSPWKGEGGAGEEFDVVVLGHLREVKDPMRTATASRLLPPESNVRVRHLGGAREPGYQEMALREAEENPRYFWLGERDRTTTIQCLAESRLMVISSILEGGANVVSEAVVCGVPILASRIPGNVGLLGEDYPGYFPVGDTRALAELLWRAESDAGFLSQLESSVNALKGRFHPEAESAALDSLLAELA